jgi:DedD protein
VTLCLCGSLETRTTEDKSHTENAEGPMTLATSLQTDDTNDTEITLGTGKMLALFFGLVILCAVFFGMGFSMGKNSVKSAPELLPSPGASTGGRPSATPGKQTASSNNAADSKPTRPPQASPEASASGNGEQAGATPGQPSTQPPPSGAAYFVQVAAVSKQEDAEALVEALKGRQYSAFIANPSPDKFYHVQVGPFADIKEAEAMRARLVSDGYNPILKK